MAILSPNITIDYPNRLLQGVLPLNSDSIGGYHIYQSDGSTWTLLATITTTATSFTYDLSSYTSTADLMVRSFSGAIESVDSNIVTYNYSQPQTVAYSLNDSTIGHIRIKNNGTILDLPIVSSPTSELRIKTANQIGYFKLVSLDDPTASPVRITTALGIMAIGY